MVTIDEYTLPDDLYYHQEHFWVRVEEDGNARVGLNEFATKMMGPIVFIDLPGQGDQVVQNQIIGAVESGKWVGKIYAPLSGEILKVNNALADVPTLPNQDPYGEGWLFIIKPSKPDEELKNLIHGSEQIAEFLKSEIEKHPKPS